VSLILLFIASIGKAQSLGPYVIASTGHLMQDEEVKLYGSMGEPINTATSSESYMLSQGLLQALLPEALEADCSRNIGSIFFENCDDGELFFFIRMEDGTVLDPYYAKGIAFEHQEDQTIEFDFVVAEFDSPCSVASEAISITCVQEALDTPTLDFDPAQQQIVVFPNPLTDQKLNIQNLSSSDIRSYSLYDYLGRRVQSLALENSEQITVDLGEVPSGIYLLQVETEERRSVTKIIIP